MDDSLTSYENAKRSGRFPWGNSERHYTTTIFFTTAGEVRDDSQKEEFFFTTEEKAREALGYMRDILQKYGRLSAADVFEMVHIPVTRIDNCYGWTTLNGVRVTRTVYGDYAIILPKRKEFKEEQ